MRRQGGSESNRSFFFYFGVVMGCLYMACGVLLIMRGGALPQIAALPQYTRWVIGIILIAYGVFRIGRGQYRRRIRQSFNEEEILDKPDKDENL